MKIVGIAVSGCADRQDAGALLPRAIPARGPPVLLSTRSSTAPRPGWTRFPTTNSDAPRPDRRWVGRRHGETAAVRLTTSPLDCSNPARSPARAAARKASDSRRCSSALTACRRSPPRNLRARLASWRAFASVSSSISAIWAYEYSNASLSTYAARFFGRTSRAAGRTATDASLRSAPGAGRTACRRLGKPLADIGLAARASGLSDVQCEACRRRSEEDRPGRGPLAVCPPPQPRLLHDVLGFHRSLPSILLGDPEELGAKRREGRIRVVRALGLSVTRLHPHLR